MPKKGANSSPRRSVRQVRCAYNRSNLGRVGSATSPNRTRVVAKLCESFNLTKAVEPTQRRKGAETQGFRLLGAISPVQYPLLNPCYTHPKPLVFPSYLKYEGDTRGLGWVYDGHSMGYRINRFTRSLERRKEANRRFYMEAAAKPKKSSSTTDEPSAAEPQPKS